MKKKIIVFAIPFFIMAFFISHSFGAQIKKPCVAGTFYPDNPDALSRMVDDFIISANPERTEDDVLAIIVPHAGYGYSGETSAFGYRIIKDKKYKTVIVIGTGHRFGFSGVSVFPEGKFITPLGALEIDREFAQKLINQDKEIYFEPRAFEGEHSVEVQLPFLQRVLKDFKIVPVVIGDCTLEVCKKLALLLKEAINESNDVLLVVSTDLYHGYDYEEGQVIDKSTIAYIKDMNAEGLYYGLREGRLQACGGFGTVTAISLAKELGYDKVRLLKYTDSAQVTGQKRKGIWTVGYTSLVIERASKGGAMLNKEQRQELLKIARSSIEEYLESGKKPQLKETDPALLKEMGAFVTLHKNGQLRGCIGNLVGKGPFYLTIRDMAVESATADPRFPAVTAGELKEIDIEISALSPLVRIDDPDKIRMGIDGVLVRKGFRSGVFLPQVATETGWNKDEFMSNLCAHKAGLPSDAWKGKDIEIYTFTAEIFSEKEL